VSRYYSGPTQRGLSAWPAPRLSNCPAGASFPPILWSVGVKPQVELARRAGLAVNRGVVVDDGLATSDPDIFALGECAEHQNNIYGLVEPAYEQAKILARRLAGDTAATYAARHLRPI
jgi:nitrite reductase (NADH) large subunit